MSIPRRPTKSFDGSEKTRAKDVELAKELRPIVRKVMIEMCKDCKSCGECSFGCFASASAAVLFNRLTDHLRAMQKSLAFEIAHPGFSVPEGGAK